MQEPPIFVKMGFEIETYDENGFPKLELKDGAPEAAQKSYKTFVAWEEGLVDRYDNWDEYLKAMEQKTHPLFGFEPEKEEKTTRVY